MAVLENVVVPKNSGKAFIVKKGQKLRVAGGAPAVRREILRSPV